MRLRLAMALLVLTTGSAHAGNITVEFEGFLTVASGVPDANTGTTFSGTYTYDDTALLQMLDADSALYAFGAGFPTTGFSLVINTPTPVGFSGKPLRDIAIDNTAGGDSLAVVATTGASGDFRLDLIGGTNLFSSLALTVPDFSKVTGATLQYTNFAGDIVLLMGSLTSLSSVPEPSSAAFLGLGIAGLAWRRFRSRTRK